MKQHTFHTVKGERRKYRLDLDDDIDGFTDIPDQKDGRRRTYIMYIRPDLTLRQAITVGLHEALHAIDPSLAEEYVKRVADEQGKFVHRYLKHVMDITE